MKTKLAASLGLALAALAASWPADALRRSHDGAGEAVLVPYYSVRDDRTTLLSIVNHADQPKAVRFVLAEGRNGRAALTFNIYLSARDTWTGAIVADPQGARLVSNDDTCTAPTIPTAGVTLRDFGYRGTNDDGLGSDRARLVEGQFEAIEMGVLTGLAASAANQRQCATLVSRFVGSGIWTTQPNNDFAPPSGELSVDAQLIDVAAGSAFGIPSVAFEDFSAGVRHASPGEVQNLRITQPTLSPGEPRFVVEGDSFIAANRPADAVSLVLMAASLEAPFLLESELDASTEFVVALPTRHAYLDDRAGGAIPAGSAPVAPFSGATGSGTAPRCNPVTWHVIDRKGVLFDDDVAFLPPHLAIDDTLCAQLTHVPLTAEPPSTSGANIPRSTLGATSGRLRLGLRPDVHALAYTGGPSGIQQGALQGLPVLVVPLIEARNTAAQPGVLATYGYTGHVVRRQAGVIDF